MYLEIDQLLLLRDGEACYSGPPGGARAAITATPAPPGVPVADYLLEVICGDDIKKTTTSDAIATTTGYAIVKDAEAALPWLAQFRILLKRCFLAHRLDLVDPMLP